MNGRWLLFRWLSSSRVEYGVWGSARTIPWARRLLKFDSKPRLSKKAEFTYLLVLEVHWVRVVLRVPALRGLLGVLEVHRSFVRRVPGFLWAQVVLGGLVDRWALVAQAQG